MDGGEILEINTPKAFFQRPGSERAGLFLGQLLLHGTSADE
jgi:hypothetical protein